MAGPARKPGYQQQHSLPSAGLPAPLVVVPSCPKLWGHQPSRQGGFWDGEFFWQAREVICQLELSASASLLLQGDVWVMQELPCWKQH